MKIALLGAESTGKTSLCAALADRLRERGQRVAVVPELLRAWVGREGREPRPEEQLPIARAQEAGVDQAAAQADMVVADTTALMVAIHGAMLYEDGELYLFALQRLHSYDAILLMGLDLPWSSDGLQRQGPQAQAPVDALVRAALQRAGAAYRVVYGCGEERVRNALLAIDSIAAQRHFARAGGDFRQGRGRWQHICDGCGDPQCEQRLFRGLGGAPGRA